MFLRLLFLYLSFLLLNPFSSFSKISIILRESFIDSMKLRVSYDANFYIDSAHKKPNTAKNDGDLHIAGRDLVIGMPSVAEIMNANKRMDAVDFIHKNSKTGYQVTMSGVWRLWCEHANTDETFEQGKSMEPFNTTNPSHVFELHPVLKIGSLDLTKTLEPITGFTYKKAEDAFYRYANTSFKIKKLSNGRVKLTTNGVGYNYIKFLIELDDDSPKESDDNLGTFAFCKVYSLDGELISHKVRMVFVKGTKSYNKFKNMEKGDQLKVVGIPRINFSLIKWRLDNSSDDLDVLERNLPYEMVIVAHFK